MGWRGPGITVPTTLQAQTHQFSRSSLRVQVQAGPYQDDGVRAEQDWAHIAESWNASLLSAKKGGIESLRSWYFLVHQEDLHASGNSGRGICGGSISMFEIPVASDSRK